ncbi:hypothetical protein K435DRAFT_76786 [Dendrothele bispora CBS 962.96]|uniref:SCD domain-containing protein n=1 Tax=Dendrothele bispora (strain CBS 962.96) TaxID=1314807 RepID=A0A4S8MSA2_DENBC|nr:hypothetical protein K435DRAFT_76786 [Dendrothele bispora CBS 962.96]
MSSPAGPRRSQREKRPPKPVTTVTEIPTISRKRKHADDTDGDNDAPPDTAGDDEDDGKAGDEDPADDADLEDDGDDTEDDDADDAPKKKRRKNATKKSRKEKDTSTRKPRKPRVPKDPNAPIPAPSSKRAPKPRARPKVNPGDESRFDPETLGKLTEIKMDNPIFNALLNPNAALQSTTEDFLESLDQDANSALAELVNMILRACGCSDIIDGDTVIDFDGVVDRLDDIVESLKQTTTPAGTYPLTSRAPPFHNAKLKYNFRAHLSEFLTRLITSAALLGSLYSSQLMETLLTWLVPMSSSQIRSIRHTATVVALEIEKALCEVGKDVEKEAEVAGRMREGEKKRARTKAAAEGSSSVTRGKEKEMEAKMREVKERQKKLEEFIREFVDGVFIHRYRDLDPLIRTECISSLSSYFAILPSHFCSNSTYLRYVGWVLSDSDSRVRMAAIRALDVVYERAGASSASLDTAIASSTRGKGASKTKPDRGKGGKGGGVVLPALTHFTTRFLPRLLEIARYDVDVGVRVGVMGVLGCIDELGLLPESDRSRLGTMIYSEEPKIRKGVARFVKGAWEEWVESKIGEVEIKSAASLRGRGRGGKAARGRGGSRGGRGAHTGTNTREVDEDKVGIKGLVSLLVRWGRTLDRGERKRRDEDDDDDDEGENEERDNGNDTEADTRNSTNTDTETNRSHGSTSIYTSANPHSHPTTATNAGTKATTTEDLLSARNRTALAIEALWDEMHIVRDWEGILGMLVKDHSAFAREEMRKSPKKGETGQRKGASAKSKATANKVNGRTRVKDKGKGNAQAGVEEDTEDRQEEDGHEPEDEDEDEDEEDSSQVDEAWRLNEVEEGVLLEMLLASLRLERKEDDSNTEAITCKLIKSLPRLFIKYQTDENRIAKVLLLPMLMKLETYLEMREQAAYTALWSDVSKQFQTHTSPLVLSIAVYTITSHFLPNTSLSNINSQQILELEDELATSLRDTVAGGNNAPPVSASKPTSTAGRNPNSSSQVPDSQSSEQNPQGQERENLEDMEMDRDIEVCHLSEDEALTLSAIVLRLRILAGQRDMTAWMEESEGGTQSSAWDVLCSIAERGRLSLDGEGEMIEQTLQLLTLHIIWKSHHLTSEASPIPEEIKYRDSLLLQRGALLERLVDYAVGTSEVGNGVVEGVKRVAFKNLLDLHVLFSSAETHAADGSHLPLASEIMALNMDDEVQWRCAGYVQAEVERYADSLNQDPHDTEGGDVDGENEIRQSDSEMDTSGEGDQTGDEEEDGSRKKGRKAKARNKGINDDKPVNKVQLEQEYVFIDVVSTFLRAIRAGAIHVRHGATLLAYFGRLGPAYDVCAKVVVDMLKEEGICDNSDLVVLVVTQAMKESFNIVQTSRHPDETGTVLLAKLLSGCFLIRGSQLAILHRLDAQYIVQVHTNLITWISKQLGTHQTSNKKQMKADIRFFRALTPLVTSVQSRDALKIKAHLDQALAQASIEPTDARLWEPLRAYEKRLGKVMGKDKRASASTFFSYLLHSRYLQPLEPKVEEEKRRMPMPVHPPQTQKRAKER